MRIDRNAAPIVAHAEETILFHRHVDSCGVAGHRFVHRIVEHFGKEMMQGGFVGAADIHAWASPHRLKPLQNLDRRGVIVGLAGRAAVRRLFQLDSRLFIPRRPAGGGGSGSAKKIVIVSHEPVSDSRVRSGAFP